MRPLDEKDFALAADLLHEGFPRQKLDFWLAALQRLQRYGDNAQMGVPLGWFMLHAQQAVGVVLTPASLRRRADGSTQRVVNLSSWYVRTEFRWRAGFMLRGVMSEADTIYTDLTATPEVQKILPLMHFQPVNQGVALQLLPLLCLHPGGGATLRPLQPTEPWAEGGPLRAQIEAHRDLGCLPLVLQPATGAPQLVIVKRYRLRGLPAAKLVYAESLSQLLQHRGALARGLLRLGLLLFVHTTPQARSTPTTWFRRRDIWFVRAGRAAPGAVPALGDGCDAFGSELCIVHPCPRALQVAPAASPGLGPARGPGDEGAAC